MEKVGKKAKIVKPEKEQQKNFAQKLSDFISRNRKVVIAVGVTILAVLLIVGAYSIISNSVAENSSRAMELVRTKITSWGSESDQAKKDELEKTIVSDLDAIVKKWPRTFAAQQALFTKAGLSAVKKDWENVEKYSLEATDKLPKTYLAPIALETAAVAAEEQGKPDKAVEYYGRIIAQYKEDTPNLAHAYFSLGRLNEGKSEWKTALENYGKVVSDFSDSEWAKLAKDRVVFLNAQGLGK